MGNSGGHLVESCPQRLHSADEIFFLQFDLFGMDISEMVLIFFHQSDAETERTGIHAQNQH